MKKILKALGVAALAAAVVPCKVEKDEITGDKTYQSLLSRLRVSSGEDGEGTNINLDLLGGVLPNALGRNEADDYADDELDLDTLETEPVIEMSFKVERDVPPASTAEEAVERAEAEAERAEEEAEQAREKAERAREEAERAREQAEAEAETHGIDL